MGKGLQGLQTGAVAQGWAIHERIRVQVHGFQWRTKTVPGEGLRLLPNEVRRGFDTPSLSCEGHGESPGGAEDGAHHVHEVRTEDHALRKRWNEGCGEVEKLGFVTIIAAGYTRDEPEAYQEVENIGFEGIIPTGLVCCIVIDCTRGRHKCL